MEGEEAYQSSTSPGCVDCGWRDSQILVNSGEIDASYEFFKFAHELDIFSERKLTDFWIVKIPIFLLTVINSMGGQER